MAAEAGCYCGAVRYRFTGSPMFKAQCHCRECQYFAGGGPNFTLAVSNDGFELLSGPLVTFRRADLEHPVARDFCPTCGVHLRTRSLALPDVSLLKMGTLDKPSDFGGPDVVVFASEAQCFHVLPRDVPTFERLPG